MNSNDYFDKLLSIEMFYEPENVCFPPFWEFKYRFQSAQRHWELNKEFIQSHIELLSGVKGDGSAEFHDAFSETAEVDMDYFPEYLRLSTLSFSLSLLENLLGTLSEEVAADLGIKLEFENKKIPFINKYIHWLSRGCGVDIKIDTQTWKSLDAIREVRNRFIHRINRDIPEEIKKTIQEIFQDAMKDEKSITDEFVDLSLKKIAGIVKMVELAYIEFYNKTKGT